MHLRYPVVCLAAFKFVTCMFILILCHIVCACVHVCGCIYEYMELCMGAYVRVCATLHV